MHLEINSNVIKDETEGHKIMCTPPLGEHFWIYRVQLYKDQAILGFPKFSTIGIGFAQEIDWNTNLPYTSTAKDIYEHIAHNRKYDLDIKRADCIKAIEMIQEYVKEHKKVKT